MNRQIMDDLKGWKDNPDHKPLIITGARQVGKTFIVRQFGETSYQKVLEINFQDDIKARGYFSSPHSAAEISEYLELNFSEISLDNNTLLFFDEIQLVPELITSLKFLGKTIKSDIICTGSMLGVKINRTSSFPVGYVEMLTMYPMTFKEFLDAVGLPEKFICEVAKSAKDFAPVSDAVHDRFNELFSKYIICGGMPEAVSSFLSSGLKGAIAVNRRLMNDYELDIAHYADTKTRIKALDCFRSLPLQLSKENKKFQYKLIRQGGNARYYDESLIWLTDAGLTFNVNRLKRVEPPLKVNMENAIFKVYIFDTGLLVSTFDDRIINDILENALLQYKGVVYENMAAQTMKYLGISPFYYEPNTSCEIDFVIEHRGDIVPVEVKGGLHVKSTSFSNFVNNHDIKRAYRFSKKNFGKDADNKTLYAPIYAMEWVLAG